MMVVNFRTGLKSILLSIVGKVLNSWCSVKIASTSKLVISTLTVDKYDEVELLGLTIDN